MSKGNKNLSLTPVCLHDFNYYFNDYERACLKCHQIEPTRGPSLSIYSYLELLNYRPRPYNKGTYLKKFITQHQDQYNCFISIDIYCDFWRFQKCFIEKFPDEPKISIRYILYRIAQTSQASYVAEASFINIKLSKTRDKYVRICEQIFKELEWNKKFKG